MEELEVLTDSRGIESFAQRSLGTSAPEGRDVYEVYIKFRSRCRGMPKLMELLESRGAQILGVHADVSAGDAPSHVLFYLEMCDATVEVDELVEDIRHMEFVLSSQAESKAVRHLEHALPHRAGRELQRVRSRS